MHWLKVSEELVHFLLSPIFVTINKVKVLVLQYAAACCGMLQNPHVQLQKLSAAACCSCTCLSTGTFRLEGGVLAVKITDMQSTGQTSRISTRQYAASPWGVYVCA